MTKMTKTEVMRARCTPVERKALGAIAHAEGIKTSEALREVVRQAARERGLWPPDGDAKDQQAQKVDND